MATSGARRSGIRLARSLFGAPALNTASLGSYGLGASDLAPFGARTAASQLVVRNRMKSVKSIQKITKAMKMVAASKLRAVQTKTENSRGMWQPFVALLGDKPASKVEKNVILTVSTDRGLCGGINTTSVKFSRAWFRWANADEKKSEYVVIGEKGKAQLTRDSKPSLALTLGDAYKFPLNFSQTSVIVDEILKNVEFDAIRIIYNRFNSVVSFVPTTATVLSPELLQKDLDSDSAGGLGSYEFEGSENGGAEVLQDLVEFQFASLLYNAMLENSCSEQGARMSAMDSSTRNASDMLERLTLSYNRSRQASITTELIEIISGAAALEAAT
eukprot:TRINITY_DN6365_c0_g1_i1.p1 TRINITY_DN6365_c0_g1~~TRINITY_DN6365_c0_g1_i1.p1  ORF type:complete len:330 (-),score=69.30 TRINITY_DN6365_c0_g1_i1:780-1769(-)